VARAPTLQTSRRSSISQRFGAPGSLEGGRKNSAVRSCPGFRLNAGPFSHVRCGNAELSAMTCDESHRPRRIHGLKPVLIGRGQPVTLTAQWGSQ
jgi:hypothetical protein